MKIAIISGASSGIGLELAKLLDNDSLDELWLIARNTDKLSKLNTELKTEVRLLTLDLLNEKSFDEIKDLLNQLKPEIKYLICSAGVGFNGSLESLTEKQISQTIALNCSSLSILNRISLNYLTEGSRIINISSGAAFTPQPYFSVYAASKAYVNSFSRAIGQELKSRKIYVTAVCPGPVDTPFFSSLDGVKEYKKKFLILPNKVAIGALKASQRKKKIYTPTISMKLVHLASKLMPTSLILKFYKN
ncbi:MAG: SDR family NAD(P)-dependent oxidoreductase [Clostridia bacterium]|nr:SDR family NAD(P)-dependent oxidoreductase [Clostridia bacterium]